MSNLYTDGNAEMFLSTKDVPSIMVLTHIEIEKYHKVSEAYHKVNEAKIKVKSIQGQRYLNDLVHI